MEELAIKIAETLDISVQGAIDMYPVIRNQYIWYKILTDATSSLLLLGTFLMVLIGITFTLRKDIDKFDLETEEPTEKWKKIDRIFKIEIYVFVSSVVIGIVADTAISFLAPDIMLIKNFLG